MSQDVLDGPEAAALQVSELIARLRFLLDEGLGEVWVEGEISSLYRSRPGHCYFDLKDEDGQLRCVLFRRQATAVDFDLEDGMRVRVRAQVDLYAQRGTLQLVVSELKPAGEGELKVAFERMKQRLAEEGLFDAVHKRSLPAFPSRIGLVTSRGGAVLHDFLRGLRRREAALEVVLYDSRVQGEGAWREVVRGLHLLDADPTIEAIVLARGGGSLEDLWTFNREELVRAIFAVETPVVSAIGHEVDFVLTDLVADARAATPTAAADLMAPDAGQLRSSLRDLRRRLMRAEQSRIRDLQGRLLGLRRGLLHPARRLAELRHRLDVGCARLLRAAQGAGDRRRARLQALGGRLDALSPLAVLARGFSVARRAADGAILRSSGQAPPGTEIDLRLAEGALRAAVTDPAKPS